MTDGIFLLTTDKRLVPMSAQPYESEDLLQTLIADYPDLLAGEQMDQGEPRRWLLIKREMPVPGTDDGTGRWSLDHLFLDQQAIPTLVEVKRSTDTRIRREVVGQMLDYAANAVMYIPVEEIRARFERQCESKGVDAAALLSEFLAGELNPDEFWNNVRTNLQAGRVRLVFVADLIPPELRRIVEFLNQQMSPAEVLAVEIKQYVGREMRTLVPRVIGGTQAAEAKKSVQKRAGEPWTEERFFAVLADLRGESESSVARRLYDWGRENFGQPKFGSGEGWGNCSVQLQTGDQRHVLFDLGTPGPVSQPTIARTKPASVAIRFGRLSRLSAFTEASLREELRTKLNAIPGVSIAPDDITRHPNFPLTALAAEPAMQAFQEIIKWVAQLIRDGATQQQ